MIPGSDIRCPRCRERYRKEIIPNEWAQCVACRHRWLMPADAVVAVPPAIPGEVPARMPPPVANESVEPQMASIAKPELANRGEEKPPTNPVQSVVSLPPLPSVESAKQESKLPQPSAAARFPSDEYKPLETREINDSDRPLTTKHTPSDGKPAVVVPESLEPLPATPVAVAAHPPQSLRTSPSNSENDQESVDANLFERAANEAQALRSQQPTLAEPITPNGVPLTAYCSMCGCRFTSLRKVGEQDSCPDCKAAVTITAEVRSPVGDPLLGRTLRGCTIDRKIGEGGMGSVYHAKQLSLDRSVAIKVLPPELARNRNFITRFEREGKNLARINHPNILHIYDFGDDAQLGLYFMIIEFVEGKDLGEILHRERRLSPVKVLDVLRQSALGLETAWEKGVIHRDIKPDNLMLTEEGIWKVMDFGLAKASDDSRDVTALGVRVGTPAFMSPEQCDGTEVDFRSDIYSLGCTAFLALTGRLPFDGETPFSIMLKHKTEAVPSLRELVPEIPETVEELVTRMLAKKPGDRFQSLRELIDLVQDLEIRAADTTSVVRKSRGPFRAVVESNKKNKESDREQALAAVSRARQTSARPPVTPLGMPTVRDAIPAADPAPMLPDYLQPVERPVQNVKSTESPRPASNRLTNLQTPRASASGDNLRLQLARARSQTQQDEASALIAEAEHCEASGLHAAAAVAWSQAADMIPDVSEGRLLQNRAEAARRRYRWQRFVRTMVVLLVMVGVLSIGTWLATPRIHNAIADGELQTILSVQNPIARRKAIQRFLEEQGHAYVWYERLFSTSYAVVAAIRARDELSRIPQAMTVTPEVPPQPRVETLVPQAQIDTCERMVADSTIPWPVVGNRLAQEISTSTGETQRRLQIIQERVQREIHAINQDVTAITSAWTAGRHVETMALVEAFAARHPRAGVAIPRMIPGRVEIVDADSGRIISEAQLSVQPMDASPSIPAVVVPVGRDGVFVRPEKIGMIINVSAPAYRSDRVVIPNTSDANTPVKIALHPGQVWRRKIGNRSPWLRIERLDDTTLILLGPDVVTQIQTRDGKSLSRLERSDVAVPVDLAIGASQWSQVWTRFGEQLTLGSTDGVVVAINPFTMTVTKTLFHGKSPILTWLEKDLTLQTGKALQVMIEGADGAMAVVASIDGRERWRYPGLRGRRQPALWSRDDQILVMDDQTLGIFEELEGRLVVSLPFSGPRTSAPVVFAQGQLVATATASGLDVFQIAGGTLGPISTRGIFDNDGTSCHAAGRDDQILVARGDRSLHLLEWSAANGLSRRWMKTLPGDSGTIEHVTLTQDYAIVTDDGGVMYLYARQDGALLRRMTHGAGLATAPLQLNDHLLVGDRDGQVTMYDLPRLR